MDYREALKLWGKTKLENTYPFAHIDPDTVWVSFDFDKGFACCGGQNPDCYCSLAQSPSANVTINGVDTAKGWVPRTFTISPDDFDFAAIVGEIVAAGDGVLEASDGR